MSDWPASPRGLILGSPFLALQVHSIACQAFHVNPGDQVPTLVQQVFYQLRQSPSSQPEFWEEHLILLKPQQEVEKLVSFKRFFCCCCFDTYD